MDKKLLADEMVSSAVVQSFWSQHHGHQVDCIHRLMQHVEFCSEVMEEELGLIQI